MTISGERIMENTEKLLWKHSKTYFENGTKMKIVAEVSLDDDCHNKHCDFSITCMIYEIKGSGKLKEYMGGCCHEEIAKHFPELKKFIQLHLCSHGGEPMYPVENGIFHIINSAPSVAMEYLRITPAEFLELSKYLDEKLYFKYLLFKLGIVNRWKKEADEFIAFLEEKTGKKWVNPYSFEEERHRLLLTDEERMEVEKRISENGYTAEALEERRSRKLHEKLKKQAEGVMSDYEHGLEKLNAEKETLLHILNCGVPLDNVIYYKHSDKAEFNWRSYEKKVSKEDFERIVESRNGKLPEFVNFTYQD